MTITTETLLETINNGHTKIQAALTKAAETDQELAARLTAVEQRVAANNGGGGGGRRLGQPTWGSRVVSNDRLTAFKANGFHGKVSIQLENAITTPSGVEQRDLVAPDRQPIQSLPQQKLTIRNLIPATPTTSNLRAEERTALAVRVPDSFVFIDDLGVGFSG